MEHRNVLILPGWQNSGPTHWQSLWESKQGYRRVEQHDWDHPLRGDWIAQLEEAVLTCDSAVLVAHSLGCIQVAAWASHSKNTGRIRAALLVAPGDVERDDIRASLPSWVPIARQKLPFKSTLVGSENDPYCAFDRAKQMASDWGSTFVDYGAHGHINAESGLGDWPDGHEILKNLMKD